jgi:hypothetical protein
MHSWDLFRTLTQARDGRAGEAPVEDHYPIAGNVARVQPDDIVVSEYHTPPKAREILDNIGLPDTELVVTEAGKTDGTIWRELKAQGYDITEHTGDNVLADVTNPSKCGIRATLVTQHELTSLEKACGQFGNVMREARLRSWNDNPILRGLQLHQIERNFPFLYKVAHLLHARMVDGGYTRLLLCSRDCFLLFELMRKLFFKERYEIEYFFNSRLTRYRPSAAYAEYAKERLSGKTLVVDLNGSGNSLRYMTETFGGTPLLVCGFGNAVSFLVAGGLRETSNLAPHAMVADVARIADTWEPIYVNSTGQNWRKDEILTMCSAFYCCLDCLRSGQDIWPACTLEYALRQMENREVEPLWADHLADSKAAFDLLNSGPLPHAVIL